MSFGWSAGDCFAALNLIVKVLSSLKELGGSRSEFQELLRELRGLKVALEHVDNLHARRIAPSSKLIELKSIALACQIPLEQFILKVNKYDKSLGSHPASHGRIIQNTTRKIQWLGMKDDVNKLQHYLNTHIGTINILLAEYQLDLLSLASQQASRDKLDIQSHLRAIQDAIDATKASTSADKQDIESHLQRIRDEIFSNTQRIECHLHHLRSVVDSTASQVIKATADIDSQAVAVRHNSSLLQKLLNVVGGDLRTLWMPVINILGNVRTTTEEIYTIVLEIRSFITGPDPRFTWYQEPVKVEDTLGRIFPVPSEYSLSELKGIIRMKFANSFCHGEVIAGNYELSNSKNSEHVLTGDDSVALLPGMSIVMAIIVDQPLTPSSCPMPQCGSTDTAVVQGGGRRCLQCTVWFDGTNKKRKLGENNFDSHSLADKDLSKEKMVDRDSVTRAKDSTTYYGRFKNVRCTQLLREPQAAFSGRCHGCNRTETREWRRGPDGARTLCITCGLHYAKLTGKFNQGVDTRTKQSDHIHQHSLRRDGNEKLPTLSGRYSKPREGGKASTLCDNLKATPSPPPLELPDFPPQPPISREPPKRPKSRPSQGDAVLIHFMARIAATEPLQSDDEMLVDESAVLPHALSSSKE
ncbi:hypothetical protein BKA64DRAFT_707484 [Cadophora sp. MPI-SDFR-AT-0126]|nr:hypothetical protein BKA64DRAFT_707484 [Leotiomycetes sp. MPI-SDFR-AT-0126]